MRVAGLGIIRREKRSRYQNVGAPPPVCEVLRVS